jgi:hypothetical protein
MKHETKGTKKMAMGGMPMRGQPMQQMPAQMPAQMPPRGQMMAKGGMPMVMKDGKKVPSFAADGKGKMAKGGGVESKGKTKGKMVKMAMGGSVGNASKRADGIAQKGKTKCKMV